MKVNVLVFGIVREIAGASELVMEFEKPVKAGELVEKLKDKYVELKQLKSVLVAVNSEYAKDDQLINVGDEVAVIPPVAGG